MVESRRDNGEDDFRTIGINSQYSSPKLCLPITMTTRYSSERGKLHASVALFSVFLFQHGCIPSAHTFHSGQQIVRNIAQKANFALSRHDEALTKHNVHTLNSGVV